MNTQTLQKNQTPFQYSYLTHIFFTHTTRWYGLEPFCCIHVSVVEIKDRKTSSMAGHKVGSRKGLSIIGHLITEQDVLLLRRYRVFKVYRLSKENIIKGARLLNINYARENSAIFAAAENSARRIFPLDSRGKAFDVVLKDSKDVLISLCLYACVCHV